MVQRNLIYRKILKNDLFASLLKLMVLFEKDNERKFKLIEHIAHFYFIRETGRYSDKFLEHEVIRISSTIRGFQHKLEEKDTTLHVVSHVEIAGGHNRLINNWIKFDRHRKHSIVLTKQYNNPVPGFLEASVNNSGGHIYNLRNMDSIKQAKKLLELASGYEKIIIHTHPDDAIPLLAFGNPKWTKPLYIMNQANFAFNIWTSIADIVLDISRGDKELTLNYRGCRRSEILPIPLEERQSETCDYIANEQDVLKKYHLPEDSRIITSMAADYKYTPVEKYNFQAIAEKIVERYENVCFIVIGADPMRDIWRDVYKKTHGRVIAVGILTKEEVDEVLNITDLYIDSIPISSFTCVLQAIEKNIPTATLNINGMTPDIFHPIKKSTISELLSWVDEILNDKCRFSNDIIRSLVHKNHHKEAWCSNLERIYSIPIYHTINKFNNKKRYSKYEKIFYVIFQKTNNYSLPRSLSPFMNWIICKLIKLFEINNKNN